MSATHRMILDSLRTIVIWAVSLLVGWQSFNYLQLVGFFFLLTGTCVYNEIGGQIPGKVVKATQEQCSYRNSDFY